MFPIRDHNPSDRVPWVTWALIAANIAVYLWVSVTITTSGGLNRFYADWALVPQFLSNGHGWTGLATSMFLHADLWHLGGNLLFLWIFGDNLEQALGRVGFALFYLVTGVLAGMAQWAAGPLSLAPTIGASGAIAGVMGGYLLLFPRAKVDVLIWLIVYVRIVPLNAWIILSLWFAVQVIGGLGSDAVTGGVAYWAHIGGFVAGLVLMVPAWLAMGGRRFWDRTHGLPPHPEGTWGPLRTTTIPQIRRKIRRRSPWGS